MPTIVIHTLFKIAKLFHQMSKNTSAFMSQIKNHNVEDQPVKSYVNVWCVCACAVQIVFWLVWVCLNLLAGAVTCLWLNIHVPSGHAQVFSCLTSLSICSCFPLFFCLFSAYTCPTHKPYSYTHSCLVRLLHIQPRLLHVH